MGSAVVVGLLFIIALSVLLWLGGVALIVFGVRLVRRGKVAYGVAALVVGLFVVLPVVISGVKFLVSRALGH
jgi:Trk-type K+ transport system membrane component